MKAGNFIVVLNRPAPFNRGAGPFVQRNTNRRLFFNIELELIACLAVVLVWYPESGLFGEIIHDTVDSAAVTVIVVPGTAAHLSQNIHGAFHIRQYAIGIGQLLLDMLIPVQALHIRFVVIVAGRHNKVGDCLPVRALPLVSVASLSPTHSKIALRPVESATM